MTASWREALKGLYAWSPRARPGKRSAPPAEFAIIDQFASDGGTIYAGGRKGGVYKVGSDGVPMTLSPLTVTSIVPLRGQSTLFLAKRTKALCCGGPPARPSVNAEKPTEAFQGAQEIWLGVDPQTPGRVWAGTNQGLFLGEARDWLTDRD